MKSEARMQTKASKLRNEVQAEKRDDVIRQQACWARFESDNRVGQ